MSERLKGFIFGSVIMLISPALALPGTPQTAAAPEAVSAAPALQYFRLTYADAEEALGQALAERGAGSKIGATITSRGDEYVFSYSQPISVEIRGLRFDATTQRFSANLVSMSGKDVISAKPVSGRFDEMVEVPVLRRSIRAGEMIKAEDLELRDYTKARARMDTVTDMASLIGKSPLRVITSGRPIRSHELEQASVIKKNDIVSVLYRNGAMSISTKGQAIDGGAEGTVISVKNIESKKVVQARVLDASTVLIEGSSDTQARIMPEKEIYAN